MRAWVGQGPQAPADSNPEELLLRAQKAGREGDYQTAAANYRAFLKAHPGEPEILANLGLMEFMEGQYRDAKQSLESALRMRPDLLAPNLFLGLDLLKLHQPQEALRHLQIAYKVQPENETLMLGLGEAYSQLDQLAKGSEMYARILQAHPKNIEALYGLGSTSLGLQEETAEKLAGLPNNAPYAQLLLVESFRLQQRASDALHIDQKLLASYASFQGLHADLGFAFLQLGDWPSAESAFRTELGNSPGYLPAQFGLAALHLVQGRTDEGLKKLEEIREVDGNFFQFHCTQLWAELPRDQISTLQSQLAAIPAASPNADMARFILQDVSSNGLASVRGTLWEPSPRGLNGNLSASPSQLNAQGHYTACAQSLQKDEGRLDQSALLLLMRCSYYAGDYWTTSVSARSFLSHDSEDAQALFWLCKASMKIALGALTEAGSIDPNAYRVHVLLAQTYGAMKRYQASELEYQSAIKLRPRDLEAHLGLGTVYWRQMKFDAAEPELSLVLAVNPSDAQASFMLGSILVARRQYDKAEPLLKTGIHAPGEMGLHAHAALGKVYLNTGRTGEAVRELLQALSSDRDGSIHYQLYLAYKKAGDAASAARALHESEALRRQREESAAEKLAVTQ
jgi:tetratricopeptide (TPR) repeat protein